jgi:hypothetical protein
MKKLDLIQLTEQSVSTVESHLATLDSHIAESERLQNEISNLQQIEGDILASDKSDEKKLKQLLEARARLDIARANFEKTKVAISVATEETIQAAIGANHLLNSLRDGLFLARKERVGAEVKSHFVEQAHLQVDGLITAAKLVKEIDQIDRFFFGAIRPDISLSNARKLRATLSQFVAFAATEDPDLEIIA